MGGEHYEILRTFDEHNLPDLDVAVLAALELFREQPVRPLSQYFSRPLVIGSVNAEVVGRLLFSEREHAVFANEGTYEKTLEKHPDVDGVVLVSASGGKHAVEVVEYMRGKKPVVLLTNSSNPPAGKHLASTSVVVFPKNREPYTYNTSTYMGMLLAHTKEDPGAIHAFIQNEVAPRMPKNLAKYNAFFITLPPQFDNMRSMFTTKFDELFGPHVVGRVFTLEQAKHAKTVIPSDRELFISIGEENTFLGDEQSRVHIPLLSSTDYAAMMAIGYYIVGRIQKLHSPYFKRHIASYVQKASAIFNQEFSVIVE